MAAMQRRGEGKFGPRPAFLRYILRPLYPILSYLTLPSKDLPLSTKNRTKFNPCGMEPTRTFTRLRAGEFRPRQRATRSNEFPFALHSQRFVKRGNYLPTGRSVQLTRKIADTCSIRCNTGLNSPSDIKYLAMGNCLCRENC